MKIKLLLIIHLFPTLSICQGVNNIWLMGYDSKAGRPWGGTIFDFKSGAIDTSYEYREMDFEEANGVICDKKGNLLFYSNGIYIANAHGDTMINGNKLNPSAFTDDWSVTPAGLPLPQANLIIPFPNDSTKYYLFHMTIDDSINYTYSSLYLYYSVIDMTLDSGKGAVIQKNVALLSDSLIPEGLTACKHANGRDWWLIAHQNNTDLFFKYLITPSGILGPYPQNIGSKREVYLGQCVFSPDGKYFAYYEPQNAVDIFDFDRCTGNFTFKAHVALPLAAAGGTAFSPNSQVLYVSAVNYVYQFDMNAASIAASQTTVAVYDGYYSPHPPLASTFYLSQLAPDGKIYINCGNSTADIHVINNPDSLGLSCDVCQHCVHLPSWNAFTIANHPNYFLEAESGSPCDTLLTDLIPNSLSKEDGTLRLFPNPAISEEDVTFTYPSTGEHSTIIINNIEGNELAYYMLPQWSSIQRLRLPRLGNGVYLARLVVNNQSVNVKFIVQ